MYETDLDTSTAGIRCVLRAQCSVPLTDPGRLLGGDDPCCSMFLPLLCPDTYLGT